MSVSTDDRRPGSPTAAVWNVPNQITIARLILSLVLFVLIELDQFLAAALVFAVAAGTDWIDGYWARRYGQVTTLGRILDPFVDKVIICGTFIFLAAVPGSGIVAWMAVLVVGRELLVTALRGYLEGEGVDFSASLSGKLKMVLQCAAVLFSLYSLYRLSGSATLPPWLAWSLTISVWAAVLMTVYSGVEYVFAALRLIRR